jgi:PAS domain S-box-containing protein
MSHGADDYLIKPFSARELVARVATHLELARMRRETQETLRHSQEQLQLISDAVPALISYIDREQRYQMCNHAYTKWFGLEREEVIGRTLQEVLGDAAWRAIQPHVDAAFAGETRDFEAEANYRLGSRRWIHAVYTPQRDARGEVVGIVVLVTDITERKRAERALREAKEQAEQASRAKDRFLAVLSHELRTPLTPVLMTVGALEHDPDLRPDVREDLTMIKRNIELETKLIDDLLDLNRITSGKIALDIEPVDLNGAVRQVCEICRSAIREQGVELKMELDNGAGLVAADAARLQQILWNVLKNAIKFTHEGGTIRVTTKYLAENRSEVRVEDNGMGIPASMLPRIFDAFEQGEERITRQFGGLGLGLAICKALVDLHRGSIRAESDGAGQGATFVVELPGAAPATLARPTDAAPIDVAGPRQIRVLVVEDHADTARTLSRLLRGAGFGVVTVADVAGAEATAEAEAFDVLVSDLGLPDGSGYEVIRRVHAHRIVPGIAMSGYGMDEDVRRCHEAGFTEHLVKPIEITQLIAAIRRVSAERAWQSGIFAPNPETNA